MYKQKKVFCVYHFIFDALIFTLQIKIPGR